MKRLLSTAAAALMLLTAAAHAQDNKPMNARVESYETIEDLASNLSGAIVDAAIYDNNIVGEALKRFTNRDEIVVATNRPWWAT